MNRVLKQGPEAVLQGRLLFCAVVVIGTFFVFGVRLFQLQIVEGEVLQRRSDQNSIRTLRLEAPRGEVLDREGRILATTRPAFGLWAVPSDMRQADRTFRVLAQLTDRDPEWFRERIESVGRRKRHQQVLLVDDLPFDVLARVEAHLYALPGITTSVQPRRHYPQGAMAAHLIGSIGEVRADQLERDAFADYRAGEVIGQSGLESRFQAHLRGRAGGRNVVVDAAGRTVQVVDEISAVRGGRLILTLDLDLQQEAEAAFALAPDEALKPGAAVVVDVRNGDILAMVSRPGYDPNAFAGGIDAESWDALSNDEWEPLQNRATQTHYPPGSTYKAIVAAGLLEEGIVDTESKVFCPGHFRFGRRNYRCWKRPGHGWVNLKRALKESCDVYFYTFGVKLGIDRLAHYANAFGLGRRPGLLLGQEATGLVPSSTWKEQRFSQPWYPGETVSASIGQGYNLMTPLQLAQSYAAIANGGTVWKPRILLREETNDGELVSKTDSQEVGQVPVSPEHLALVVQGLEAVVGETRGTGGRARLEGVRVAGKTGTAQVVRLEKTEGMEEDEVPIRHRDHAWFGAFAPVDDPEIAVGVFVEHGLHGSSAAAPIAGRLLKRYFDKKRARDGDDGVQVAEGRVDGRD